MYFLVDKQTNIDTYIHSKTKYMSFLLTQTNTRKVSIACISVESLCLCICICICICTVYETGFGVRCGVHGAWFSQMAQSAQRTKQARGGALNSKLQIVGTDTIYTSTVGILVENFTGLTMNGHLDQVPVHKVKYVMYALL
jgi:hypothetical protein